MNAFPLLKIVIFFKIAPIKNDYWMHFLHRKWSFSSRSTPPPQLLIPYFKIDQWSIFKRGMIPYHDFLFGATHFLKRKWSFSSRSPPLLIPYFKIDQFFLHAYYIICNYQVCNKFSKINSFIIFKDNIIRKTMFLGIYLEI